MALSFKWLLPRSVRRAFRTINAGVRRGLSNLAIRARVVMGGFQVAKPSVLQPLIGALRRQRAAGEAVRVLKREALPSRIALPESVTNIRRKFSYQFRQTGFNAGGEAIERYVTVKTDNPDLTKGELEDMAQTALDNDEKYELLQNTELDMVFGLRIGADF